MANAKVLAAIIGEIIVLEPEVAEVAKELAPVCANLPAPWNLPANPVVTKAFDVFPKLLPTLQNIKAILEANPA